jgi:phosphonate transport system substrate-binding protein
MAFLNAAAADITFATYPSNNPDKMVKAFTPLAEYLSEKSGDNVKLVVTKDYAELIERLTNKTVDFALIGTSGYISTKTQMPTLRYIATYLETSADGSGEVTPYYASYIITLKDSGISQLSDAKGMLFGFTDLNSTSGYAFPMMILSKNGIDPELFFGKVFFLKKHDRVIEALLNRSIDMGAVSDGTYYNAVKAHGSIFNIIQKSEPIPLDPVVASPLTDNETADKFRDILSNIPKDSIVTKAIKEHLGWNARGFTVKSDSFYDPMREAGKYLK